MRLIKDKTYWKSMAKTTDWIGKHCAGGKEFTPLNSVTQTITFAQATTGAAATKELFAVTGTVICTMFGVCTTDLVKNGSATISLGASGDKDIIIAASDPNAIDSGDVWVSDSAIGEAEEHVSDMTWIIVNGNDLCYEIATSYLTAGVMTFYCLWYPVTSDADVVPSGSNAAI